MGNLISNCTTSRLRVLALRMIFSFFSGTYNIHNRMISLSIYQEGERTSLIKLKNLVKKNEKFLFVVLIIKS